jgi:hypothetical protein
LVLLFDLVRGVGAVAPVLILWVAGDAEEVAVKEGGGNGNEEAGEGAAKFCGDAAGFCAGVSGVGHFCFSYLFGVVAVRRGIANIAKRDKPKMRYLTTFYVLGENPPGSRDCGAILCRG